MRTIPNLIFFLVAFIPTLASGQQAGIDLALQKGNAADLGIYFAKSVDLVIPGYEDTYAADKAVNILSDFFAKQTVKGYKQVHLSAPQEGRAKYSIGDLYTAQGTFRATLYFDPQQKISEIRIQN